MKELNVIIWYYMYHVSCSICSRLDRKDQEGIGAGVQGQMAPKLANSRRKGSLVCYVGPVRYE